MTSTVILTESLEDYLKAIFDIDQTRRIVRAKYLTERLKVNNSSVTAGLKRLKSYGLINYNPYEYITLTQKGEKLARNISMRHDVLEDFLIKVLNVDPEEADEVACKMEHSMPPDITDRFVKFIDFFEQCHSVKLKWEEEKGFSCLNSSRQGNDCLSCKNVNDDKLVAENEKPANKYLSDIKPGTKVRIKKITGKGETFKKIVEMGVIPGTEVEVIKVAPLGDPMDILVRGYRLTLRKEETKQIIVE